MRPNIERCFTLLHVEWEGDGGNVLGTPLFTPRSSPIELNRPHAGRVFARLGPLRVTSRPFSTAVRMSAFGGKADVNHCVGECPLLAKSGLLATGVRSLNVL